MEAHLHDWLSLLIRWAHFITGVAWIGASGGHARGQPLEVEDGVEGVPQSAAPLGVVGQLGHGALAFLDVVEGGERRGQPAS